MGHANEHGIKPIQKKKKEKEGNERGEWRWEGAQKKKKVE